MSAFGPVGAAIARVSFGAAGPTKVGGAFGTPVSTCQFLPTRPMAAAETRSRNSATMASETMPTRSLAKRLAAARQTLADRLRLRARVDVRQVDDRAHFSTTRGSTIL